MSARRRREREPPPSPARPHAPRFCEPNRTNRASVSLSPPSPCSSRRKNVNRQRGKFFHSSGARARSKNCAKHSPKYICMLYVCALPERIHFRIFSFTFCVPRSPACITVDISAQLFRFASKWIGFFASAAAGDCLWTRRIPSTAKWLDSVTGPDQSERRQQKQQN